MPQQSLSSKRPALYLRPLVDDDLAFMQVWLEQDYIKAWYHEPEEWLREIAERQGAFRFLHHFIVMLADRPIGFGQYYDCFAAQEEWYTVQKPGQTYSIDYLLGDKNLLGKGYGKQIVRLLTTQISQIAGVRQIVVQPEAENLPSVRALLACGYHWDPDQGYYVLSLAN